MAKAQTPGLAALGKGASALDTSTPKRFLRPGLDILFVGLNVAEESSRKGHLLSVRQAFWDQLFQAGLLTEPVDKDVADDIVFGSTRINRNRWNYGIVDLVPGQVESDSRKVSPSRENCARLVADIRQYCPRTLVIFHSKVRNSLANFLDMPDYSPYGRLGLWVADVPSEFFSVPFPHGNSIHTEDKVAVYRKVLAFLEGDVSAAGDLPDINAKPRRSTSHQARKGSSTRGGAAMPPLSKLDRARRIDQLIEAWLRQTGTTVAKPKDVMPILIERGLFSKDHREGLPLRKLLRELHASGNLSVMRTVSFDQGSQNKSWYFRRPSEDNP